MGYFRERSALNALLIVFLVLQFSRIIFWMSLGCFVSIYSLYEDGKTHPSID